MVVNNFDEEKELYKLDYPEVNEKLTVSKIADHHDPALNRIGVKLLSFEEYPDMIGLCSSRIDRTLNFMLLPDNEKINKITKSLKIEEFFLNN